GRDERERERPERRTPMSRPDEDESPASDDEDRGDAHRHLEALLQLLVVRVAGPNPQVAHARPERRGRATLGRWAFPPRTGKEARDRRRRSARRELHSRRLSTLCAGLHNERNREDLGQAAGSRRAPSRERRVQDPPDRSRYESSGAFTARRTPRRWRP